MNTRTGTYRSNMSGEMAYQSFIPTPLPPNPPIEMDRELTAVLVGAHRQLTLLEHLAKRIPNVDLFVSMYVRKEALMSSQIEGTQATLEDVFDPTIDENANRDVADVINYIKATEFALRRMEELPLCNRLLRETHAVLMQGIRGKEKNPGEFRESQNWIGAAGSTIKTARYIPPMVADMQIALSDLEKYWNSNDELDVLIQTALIHYQFETIHPFLDGNGRIGRLLITLFLMEQKELSTPALYISYILKKNRIEYYDRMSEVRRTGNYEQWVRFFLEAVRDSAADAVETIDLLTELNQRNEKKIETLGRSSKMAMTLLHYLEANPIIEVRKTAAALGVTFNTVSKAIENLIQLGILKQNSQAERNRTFSYEQYLDILRRGT